MPTSSTGNGDTFRKIEEARSNEHRLTRIEGQQELARERMDAGFREVKDAIRAGMTTLHGDLGMIKAELQRHASDIDDLKRERDTDRYTPVAGVPTAYRETPSQPIDLGLPHDEIGALRSMKLKQLAQGGGVVALLTGILTALIQLLGGGG